MQEKKRAHSFFFFFKEERAVTERTPSKEGELGVTINKAGLEAERPENSESERIDRLGEKA